MTMEIADNGTQTDEEEAEEEDSVEVPAPTLTVNNMLPNGPDSYRSRATLYTALDIMRYNPMVDLGNSRLSYTHDYDDEYFNMRSPRIPPYWTVIHQRTCQDNDGMTFEAHEANHDLMENLRSVEHAHERYRCGPPRIFRHPSNSTLSLCVRQPLLFVSLHTIAKRPNGKEEIIDALTKVRQYLIE